jgi:glycine cleavage system H protein
MTGILSSLGVFVVGILARLGLVVGVIAALLTPVALVLGAIRIFQVVRPRLQGLRRTGHVLYKPGARYSAGHTWIERDGSRLRVGLDGVAQAILPWALGVRLPRPGDQLVEGQVAAVISCGGVEARIVAPLAGKVLAVNTALLLDPALVKNDGYHRGWLFEVEPADARWATLPSGEVAQRWMERESQRLDRFLEEHAAPPGMLAAPAPARAPQYTDWRDLTHTFLQA